MMLAWMLLATIGTFIPRYMKEIFKDKIVCQVHAWFAVSRKCKLSFQFDIPRGIFRPALQNSFFCFLFFFVCLQIYAKTVFFKPKCIQSITSKNAENRDAIVLLGH